MHPRHAGVISSRELAVHNVGLNGYEERGAPIGSRAGRGWCTDGDPNPLNLHRLSIEVG